METCFNYIFRSGRCPDSVVDIFCKTKNRNKKQILETSITSLRNIIIQKPTTTHFKGFYKPTTTHFKGFYLKRTFGQNGQKTSPVSAKLIFQSVRCFYAKLWGFKEFARKKVQRYQGIFLIKKIIGSTSLQSTLVRATAVKKFDRLAS